MTCKQLAQRLGVDIKQLDFELDGECKYCKKTGGTEEPCDNDDCVVIAMIEVATDKP
jgi:hypothetical protein